MYVCENIITKTRELTNSDTLLQNARTISLHFRKLWQSFLAIHNKISHSKFIEDDEYPHIRQALDMYFDFFRQEFPKERIILKQHLLEDHAFPWLVTHRFGFGLFGEQDMESIHHKIRINADNHHGTINPVSRLLSIIEEHHVHTLPEVKAQVPAIKVRRLH